MGLPLIGLAVAAPAASAQTGLRPIVECVVPETPAAGSYTTYFGYVNANPNTFVIPPDSPNNFFNPASGGDNPHPNIFEPGWHPRVKAIVRPNSAATLVWTLGSGTAEASPFPKQIVGNVASGGGGTARAGTVPVCGPYYTGAYSPTRQYVPQEIVYSGGASWIAEVATQGTEPPAESVWSPFAAAGATGATGAAGATGARGPAGETGQQGPIGVGGDAGASNGTTDAGRQRFDRRGRVTVRDEDVDRSSTIVLQYAHAGLRRPKPTNVTAVRAGRFVATGSPRARFTYVVYSAP